MTFNNGWKCQKCGPVKESKKRTIAKVQYDCCKVCGSVVTRWTRPMTERDGRCSHCGEGAFSLAVVSGQLLRCCKTCSQIVNTDKNCTVVREGNEDYGYKD